MHIFVLHNAQVFGTLAVVRAHSSVAERIHGMDEVGVRFSVGPKIEKSRVYEARLFSIFYLAKKC